MLLSNDYDMQGQREPFFQDPVMSTLLVVLMVAVSLQIHTRGDYNEIGNVM